MKRNGAGAETNHNLALATAFVQGHGSDMDRSRLGAILTGERAKGAAAYWEKLMHQVGAAPHGLTPGAPPALEATLQVLAMMRDQEIHGSAAASRMLAYLRRAQDPDGFWREQPLVYAGPGEGLVPMAGSPGGAAATSAGDAAGRAVGAGVGWAPGGPGPAMVRPAELALTSGAAFWLAVLQPEQTEPLRLAARALSAALAGDLLRRADARTLAQVAAFAWRFEGPDSELCRRAFGMLAGWLPAPGAWRRRLGLPVRRRGRLAAGTLAWCLTCCLRVGMGGVYTLPLHAALVELARLQREDGSFGGAGDPGAVEATLGAIRVLLGYGVW
jgi:hypothetical protein